MRPFIEELYETYLANPASVEPAWRDYFDKLANLPGAGDYSGPDVAHAPIINSFAQRAKEGTPAASRPSRQRPTRSRSRSCR